MSVDDVLDKEIARLERFIEHGRFPLLRKLSQSRSALITIAILVVIFQTRNMPELMANSSLDAAIAIQRPEPTKSVRLVTIDDQDYAALFHSRSPLDPDVLSKILAAVARGNPQAIVVDIDTSDPSFQSLAIPEVPTVWNVSGDQLPDGKFNLDKPLGGRTIPARSVSALAVVPRDDRGIVRGYQEVYPLETGGMVASPGYAAALLVAGPSSRQTSSPNTSMHYLDYRYRFLPIKARDLLQDADSDNWNNMAFFKGQVVVVGGTYRVARDQYATPKGVMDGCQIVAQVAAAEINRTFIPAVNRWMTGVLMIVGGLITLAVYNLLTFRSAFLVSLGLVPALSIVSNWILFHRFAAWGAMVPLVCAVIVAELYSKAALYLAFYEKVADLKKQDLQRDRALALAAKK